jgi:hypothetical protein
MIHTYEQVPHYSFLRRREYNLETIIARHQEKEEKSAEKRLT